MSTKKTKVIVEPGMPKICGDRMKLTFKDGRKIIVIRRKGDLKDD